MTFRRPPPKPAKQLGDGYTLRPRAIAEAVAGPARMSVPVPKDNPLQHAAYMDLVRDLNCDRCGMSPRSQFCHADILGKGGKGKGIKSDCRLGWPGCADCHYLVGTSGSLTKTERHQYEADAGKRTRDTINRMGLWPANLPQWQGDEL